MVCHNPLIFGIKHDNSRFNVSSLSNQAPTIVEVALSIAKCKQDLIPPNHR